MQITHRPSVREQSALSPAQFFVRQCGRVFLATTRPNEVIHTGRALSPDEWHVVFAEATTHGMAPIVYQTLALNGALASAPQEVAAALAASYTRALVGVRRIELQLDQILRAFSSSDQDILVLKGPPLVRRLYPDPGLRPIGDIDLLARPGELTRAIAVLVSLGYRPVSGYGIPTDFHALRGWTVVYRRDDAPLVELHWRPVSLAGYQRAFRPDDLWRRSALAPIAEASAYRLDPGDELRYLCVHYAAEHRRRRLVWLMDLARLLLALPEDWDWERFTQATTALGVATPVFVSLHDCHAVFGVEAPKAPLAALETAADTRDERRAWTQAYTPFYRLDRLLAHSHALDTPGERLILARGAFMHFLIDGRDYTARRLQLARNRLSRG